MPYITTRDTEQSVGTRVAQMQPIFMTLMLWDAMNSQRHKIII